MESTYVRRRRPVASSRKKSALAPRERRRLIQLAVSAGLFALVFVGRGAFPDQTARWQELLGRDADLRAVFSDLGAAVSRGEPVLDTLGELWVEVFAGGAVPAGRPVDRSSEPVWEEAGRLVPPLAQRLARREDRVSGWWAERTGEAAASAAGAAAPGPAQVGSAQAEGLVSPERMPLAVQTAAAIQVAIAQAQSFDEEGRALPAGVSLAFYELGLGETVTPVAAVCTSQFGYRDHPVSGGWLFHRGADLAAPLGSEVAAFAAGTVAYAGEDSTNGRYLKLDHGGGVATFYCHCSQIDVSPGQTVEAGQTVARVGQTGNATGPHLHFAVIKDGVYLDPRYYIEVG